MNPEIFYAILPFALVIVPLLGGVALLFIDPSEPDAVRNFSLYNSIFNLAIAVVVCILYDWSPDAPQYQFVSSLPWIPEFGLSFSFGVDGMSILLVLLTTLMMPLITLGSWTAVQERVTEFHIWLLVLEAAMIAVFMATNIIFFYVCFEFTLVPMFFLIAIWGSSQRLKAARIFFLYTFTGSMMTLAALLYVAWFNTTLDPTLPGMHAEAGRWSFELETMYAAARQMTYEQQWWVFLAFVAGFAVKVPLFPFHTWLPLAHTEAPMAGSVDLAAVLLKLGAYGLLRFAIPMCPEAAVDFAPWLGALAVTGILYAALICWVQKDIKKLIAYSSVSHMGFCVLGMFALTPEGVAGAITYMINHGLATGGLFLCVGMIYERYHTREMRKFSGLATELPVWSFFFIFFCLASVALPGLNGFVSEFLCLIGTFTSPSYPYPYVFAAVAGLGMILAAIYLLFLLGKIVWGPREVPEADDHAQAGHSSAPTPRGHDLDRREVLTLIPLVALCLGLGFFPTPMLRSLDQPIRELTTPALEVIAARQQADRDTQSQMTEAEGDGLETNAAFTPFSRRSQIAARGDQAVVQTRAHAVPASRTIGGAR